MKWFCLDSAHLKCAGRQQALASGNSESVAQVITLLKELRYEDALRQNLLATNRFGYNCLHQAANSGNFAFVQQVDALIDHAFGSDSYAKKMSLVQDRTKFKRNAWDCREINQYLYSLMPAASGRRAPGEYHFSSGRRNWH